jgi:hypothetical protein
LFYSEQLISKKLLENIYLQVKFNPKLKDVYGSACVEQRTDSGKARHFEIEMNPHIGAVKILKCLAHEMVHIKQYAYSETNDTLTRWKGEKVDSDVMDYWVQPWEIEAYGREVGLFRKFVVQEKLWEVFKNVSDPDGPINHEPIGWKSYT